MQLKGLLKKGITRKRYKQIINKILHIIKADPNFETIFFEGLIYGQTYEEIKSYCEVLGIKIEGRKIKYRIKEFAPHHLYWDAHLDYGVYVPQKYNSILQNDIIEAIKEYKQKKEDKKDRQVMLPKDRIQQETRIFTYLLHNPQAMEELNAIQISKITNTDEDFVKDIISGELRPVGSKAQELLLDKNYQIIEKGKKKILEKIDTLDVEKMQDLKALSDILDTSFKQNRLIEGKSTENAMVGVADIYDAIIINADKNKERN